MMKKILELTGLRMTHREYRANLDGLNIFFGAVLGFVLAGAEALGTVAFSVLLLMTASMVVTILYISSSDKRLTYAVFAIIAVAVLPRVFDGFFPGLQVLPRNLQPTLAVWVGMTILVEFLPRGAPDGKADQ